MTSEQPKRMVLEDIPAELTTVNRLHHELLTGQRTIDGLQVWCDPDWSSVTEVGRYHFKLSNDKTRGPDLQVWWLLIRQSHSDNGSEGGA